MFGMLTGKNSGTRGVCQVSYTLNNFQPVVCTIIGDKPLFYIDYECDYEDEFIAEDNLFAEFEEEINILREEISKLGSFSDRFSQPEEQNFHDFLSNAFEIIDPVKISEEKEDICEALKQSRLGSSYLDFAKNHGVDIIFSNQVEKSEFNYTENTIFVSHDLKFEDQVLLLVRELRSAWQFHNYGYLNPLQFIPDDAIFVNRLIRADLSVSMVRAAWELQLAGENRPWEKVENSSLADMGRALAREAFFDFRTLSNGEACMAVFETWFMSERCLTADKKIIQDMLADYQGYVFDCEAENTKKSVTHDLIVQIGSLPYGKNYLSSYIEAVMGDPSFRDVRDRANANFLWFIKFEQSFRETEQKLQSDPVSITEGVRSSVSQKKNQGQNDDGTSGRIIPLSEYVTGQSQTVSETKELPDDSAEIIYLRRWSSD